MQIIQRFGDMRAPEEALIRPDAAYLLCFVYLPN
jgi:hypothetical protein